VGQLCAVENERDRRARRDSGPRAASVSAITARRCERPLSTSTTVPFGFLASSSAAPVHQRASDATRSDAGGGPPDLRFESDIVPGDLSGGGEVPADHIRQLQCVVAPGQLTLRC